MHRLFRPQLLTLLALAAACASADEPGARPTVVTTADLVAPTAITPPPAAWSELSFDDRKQHMIDHVLPTMQTLTQQYDSAHFANFSCSSCHGSGARKRNYAMPSASLPTLYPSGSQEQKDTVASHHAMATFMFQKVTPTMRELLALPKFDKGSGKGFSCFYCHPKGEPATPTPMP